MKTSKGFKATDLEVNSLEELRGIFFSCDIPIHEFGTSSYKSIETMWSEIQNGSMSLAIYEEELVRKANVIRVHITTQYKGQKYVLIEFVQGMLNDKNSTEISLRGIRYRHTLYAVWGKIEGSEDVQIATQREIAEELFKGNLKDPLATEFLKSDVELEDPMDYPEIRSLLTTHTSTHEITAKNFQPSYWEIEDDKLCVFNWVAQHVYDAYLAVLEEN